MKSMTAYGAGESQLGDTRFTAEIRSVNNRYRDIILRVPKNFQALEKELRGIIASRVRRGRIEVSIQMEANGEEAPYHLELNVPLVNSYLEVFNQLAKQCGLNQEIRLDTLCQMKDVILMKSGDLDMEELRPGIIEALTQALDSLDEMRLREGGTIEADFVERLQLLEGYIGEVEERCPFVVERYRNRLQENVGRMQTEVAVDESRLAQEVAFFAERSDITEEIVRIRSHLKQFHEYLSGEGALGKRLDFLIQELNREVNTVSAKASDAMISKVVVEMKAELEKLREQVQNVE